ncbi:MAG: hypothetical protein R3B95_11830 [Nitrospirales bacterium]|nr:hypothetical protein [Nitrospirales bacterium]
MSKKIPDLNLRIAKIRGWSGFRIGTGQLTYNQLLGVDPEFNRMAFVPNWAGDIEQAQTLMVGLPFSKQILFMEILIRAITGNPTLDIRDPNRVYLMEYTLILGATASQRAEAWLEFMALESDTRDRRTCPKNNPTPCTHEP